MNSGTYSQITPSLKWPILTLTLNQVGFNLIRELKTWAANNGLRVSSVSL